MLFGKHKSWVIYVRRICTKKTMNLVFVSDIFENDTVTGKFGITRQIWLGKMSV